VALGALPLPHFPRLFRSSGCNSSSFPDFVADARHLRVCRTRPPSRDAPYRPEPSCHHPDRERRLSRGSITAQERKEFAEEEVDEEGRLGSGSLDTFDTFRDYELVVVVGQGVRILVRQP